MLRAENISTGYGKKQVLFDVSFEVMQGEIVLLAGSNGSGKSTLLKAIFGILPQWSRGQIFFEGESITSKPTATLLKKGLLYIPQKNNLFEDLTVKENLEMVSLNLDNKKERIEKMLSAFKALVPHLKRIPMKLSGGERQLLTLAMATLHKPKMILIDEPFTGLSPQNITFVIKNLIELNQKTGVTLLIVEHRVKECSSISNRIIGLKLGKIFSEMEVNSTFNVNELHSVFL
jgi:branched-chain amino acid transport system ATP-binding protein